MKILTQTIRAIQTPSETPPKYPIASRAYAGALDKLPILFFILSKYVSIVWS